MKLTKTTYICLLDIFDTMGVDAEFRTEHALMPLHEIELAQVGLWSVSIIDLWLRSIEINGLLV